MASARRRFEDDLPVRSAAGQRIARDRMILLQAVPIGREAEGSITDPRPDNAPSVIMLPRLTVTTTAKQLEVASPELGTPDIAERFSIRPDDSLGRRSRLQTILMSGLAHGALLALAFLVFPQGAELPTGGETAIPVEMIVVAADSLDTAATAEGAAPETANVQVPLPDDRTADAVIPMPEVVLPDPAPPLTALALEIPSPAPVKVEPVTANPILLEAPDPDAIRRALAEQQARRDDEKRRALAEQRRERQQARLEEQKEEQRQKQRDERLRQQAHARAQQRAAETATSRPVAPKNLAGPGTGDAGVGPDRRTQQARQAGGGTQGEATTAGAAQIASWRAQVIAHLARFKRYPAAAEEREIIGRSGVSFSLSKSGQVLSVALAGSSGHGMLDQEAVAMVRRAAPFPAAPAGAQATHSFNTGVRFDIR